MFLCRRKHKNISNSKKIQNIPVRKIKELIPLLLLGLYLSYEAGITMFTHVHYVNGVVVVHSHPSKSKKHSHTRGQYLLIHQLNHVQTLEVSIPVSLNMPELYYILLKEKIQIDSKQKVSLVYTLLRAPPSLVA